MVTHYTTLGISEDATKDDIKKAYRKLVMKHHPDRGGDVDQFKAIQAAYDVLSNQSKREEYDSKDTYDIDSRFEDILRGFGRHHRTAEDPFRRRTQRNPDTRITISVEVSSLLEDVTKIISIKQEEDQKHVEITIPRGCRDRSTIRFPKFGGAKYKELPPGDLIVNVHHLPGAFIVDQLDVITEVRVSCFEAIVGTEKIITALDSKDYKVKVPAGVKQDTIITMKGHGFYQRDSEVRGDLRLWVKIDIPKKDSFTEEQLEFISSLTQ